ncbi:unnamed protein product [Prorocentrum cordatum]|uniref:Uncharacterized protein n=1 Tax=Prorocentrum cordatum TaxID=2364126 RepID=A0ABN9P8L3_9DINO|nr:unnamed protein product [Polarella glacialis]
MPVFGLLAHQQKGSGARIKRGARLVDASTRADSPALRPLVRRGDGGVLPSDQSASPDKPGRQTPRPPGPGGQFLGPRAFKQSRTQGKRRSPGEEVEGGGGG